MSFTEEMDRETKKWIESAIEDVDYHAGTIETIRCELDNLKTLTSRLVILLKNRNIIKEEDITDLIELL